MRSDYYCNMLSVCFVSRFLYSIHKSSNISSAERVMYQILVILHFSLNCCSKMSSRGSLSWIVHFLKCHWPVIISRSITLSVTTFSFVSKMISICEMDKVAQSVQMFLVLSIILFQNGAILLKQYCLYFNGIAFLMITMITWNDINFCIFYNLLRLKYKSEWSLSILKIYCMAR